jgi:hypothetical protein
MSPAERIQNHHYETPKVYEQRLHGGTTSIETTHGALGPLDVMPTAAEVPHLDELAKKAIPVAKAKAIGMHVLHGATDSGSEHTHQHAA